MLKTLSIKNIAVIENVNIDLSDGFNILTGETGAGKSIIIDSINLVKGERAQKDIIRTGEEKARVDALFDVSPLCAEKLKDILGMDIDGEMLVSREIDRDGKGSIRINGAPVTLGMLKQAGEHLVAIHGQHDNTSLLQSKNHIGFLDSYGGAPLAKAKDEYIQYHKQYKEINAQLESICEDAKDMQRRIELLTYQIEEIDMASLTIGEDEELKKKKAVIENSYKIAEATNKAYTLLYEGTSMGQSAYDTLSGALKAIEAVTSFDAGIEEVYSSLADAQDTLKESARFLKGYSDSLEFASDKLDEIDDRLDLLQTLKIKYGQSIEAILKKRDDMQDELDSINLTDRNKRELAERLEIISQKRETAADTLSAMRKESAASLCSEVMASLAELCMPKVVISADFKETEYKGDGKDDVEFLISTNAGEDAKPLSRIASGGELSRIMLAIKGALADITDEEVLIFDEIDTGVSGLAAQKIAERLYRTSRFSQVICITHLPQIAAMADSHYLIEKKTDGERTRTFVHLMNEEERTREIARTLGGASITDAALQNACELIELAKKEKNQ